MAKYPYLKLGSKGRYVTKVQKILKLKMLKYGTFDKKTQQAVGAFQKKHGMKVTGRVGKQTWLLLTEPKRASALRRALATLRSLGTRKPSPGWAMPTWKKKQTYGYTEGQVWRNLVRIYWIRKGKSFTIHKRHAVQVRRAIAKIDRYELRYNKSYRITSIQTYNWRLIRGGNTLSNHSFGSALDINPGRNPMSWRLRTDMPKYFINAWKSEGARWGGNYRRRKDAMHYEF